MSEKDFYLISPKKLIIFGASKTGKSSFAQYLCGNKYDEIRNEKKDKDDAIITTHIEYDLKNKDILNLNLYEVLIDEKIIKDESQIHNCLFDCQCALFFIDITSNESFQLIKQLLNLTREGLYPFLKKILILNKLDLDNKRKVNFLEITDFLYGNKELELDNIEISMKTEENLDKLIEKINNAVNKTKNQIPINIIYETDALKYKNKETPLITIILVGDSLVGKSSFINRYFKNHFTEEFITTMGIDKQVKVIKIDKTEYKLNVWDTAGQERYRSLPKKYYQNADGILILFDITNVESFKNVNYWLENIENNIGKNEEKQQNIFLIGNKIDLNNERAISRFEAETFANNLGLKYYETSSKINLNINEVISRMIIDCHMDISKTNDVFDKSTKNSLITSVNSNQSNGTEGGCCGGSNKKENENIQKKRESLETIRESDNNENSK